MLTKVKEKQSSFYPSTIYYNFSSPKTMKTEIINYIQDRYNQWNELGRTYPEPNIGVETVCQDLGARLMPYKTKRQIKSIINHILTTSDTLESSIGVDDWSGRECRVFNPR